jgi:hypothetical protein
MAKSNKIIKNMLLMAGVSDVINYFGGFLHFLAIKLMFFLAKPIFFINI